MPNASMATVDTVYLADILAAVVTNSKTLLSNNTDSFDINSKLELLLTDGPLIAYKD